MYVIKVQSKVEKSKKYDYVFKDFSTFYEVADLLTISLFGKYEICVQTDVVKDIQAFLKQENKYSHLMVTVLTCDSVIEFLLAYHPNLRIQENVKPYDIYLQLLTERHLLLEKKSMRILYNSIGHTEKEMVFALDSLLQEYGERVLITEAMLSELFILNKITYPRSVLIAYLQMERWRESKLKKCLVDVGNEVTLGAMIKNIKSLVNEKIIYLKTGQGNWLAKSIPTQNLLLMYKVLVTERCSLDDVTLLLMLYEKGCTVYDYIRED